MLVCKALTIDCICGIIFIQKETKMKKNSKNNITQWDLSKASKSTYSKRFWNIIKDLKKAKPIYAYEIKAGLDEACEILDEVGSHFANWTSPKFVCLQPADLGLASEEIKTLDLPGLALVNAHIAYYKVVNKLRRDRHPHEQEGSCGDEFKTPENLIDVITSAYAKYNNLFKQLSEQFAKQLSNPTSTYKLRLLKVNLLERAKLLSELINLDLQSSFKRTEVSAMADLLAADNKKLEEYEKTAPKEEKKGCYQSLEILPSVCQNTQFLAERFEYAAATGDRKAELQYDLFLIYLDTLRDFENYNAEEKITIPKKINNQLNKTYSAAKHAAGVKGKMDQNENE